MTNTMTNNLTNQDTAQDGATTAAATAITATKATAQPADAQGTIASAPPAITPAMLLEHWQGHRRLTRRVVEAFPEDRLFTFSAGGMRTFALLALETVNMVEPTLRGVVEGDWSQYPVVDVDAVATKSALLDHFDEADAALQRWFPKIDAERFLEVDTAFGQWTMQVALLLMYVIDNEIHHRGQGYVYLRMLGIEPPPFWER
ncbi:MAG: DinB family protein [Trueperaceae bacterium]